MTSQLEGGRRLAAELAPAQTVLTIPFGARGASLQVNRSESLGYPYPWLDLVCTHDELFRANTLGAENTDGT